MLSAAEVTSHDSWYSATQESSAFRRLGCARLYPVNTLLGSVGRSNVDDLRHTAVQPQQGEHELSQMTADEAERDFETRDTTQNDRRCASASGLDRVANVSVHFRCSPSAAQLARTLQATRGNNRRISATDVTSSPCAHLNSFVPRRPALDKDDRRVPSFDDLPDSVVIRMFSSGLDSYELCRCGLVCRRWNALVWNDARLWTTIDLGCYEALDVDEALRTVTRALSRSTPPLCLGVEEVHHVKFLF